MFRDYFSGAAGLSFNNILSSVIVTPAGFNAFVNDELNKALKEILADRCKYLDGEDSDKEALTDDQWLSIESKKLVSIFTRI